MRTPKISSLTPAMLAAFGIWLLVVLPIFFGAEWLTVVLMVLMLIALRIDVKLFNQLLETIYHTEPSPTIDELRQLTVPEIEALIKQTEAHMAWVYAPQQQNMLTTARIPLGSLYLWLRAKLRGQDWLPRFGEV